MTDEGRSYKALFCIIVVWPPAAGFTLIRLAMLGTFPQGKAFW